MEDTLFITEAAREFRRVKDLADRAMAQVADHDYFAVPDDQSNSLAVIVKHVAGNLISRWTDFLSTDGEKPDRRRDQEFELTEADTRSALSARWEEAWRRLFQVLDELKDGDVERLVTIRGEPHTVARAVNRQISHYAYHAGQIVLLARHYVGNRWQTLSIPRGGSEAFNQEQRGKRHEDRGGARNA